MLRLFHILSLSVAVAVGGGCITPAQITTAESDATLPALGTRAGQAAAPLPHAEPPPEPTARPVANHSITVVPAAELPVVEKPVPERPAAAVPAAVRPAVEWPVAQQTPPEMSSVLTRQPQPVPPPAPLPNPPFAAAQPEPVPTGADQIQRIKPIQQISLDISPRDAGDMLARIPPPENHAERDLPRLAQEAPFVRGDLIDYGMSDNTPLPPVGLDLCYQPLYFQELNAERFGRSWGILQPAVSVANFYGRIPLLPYMTFAYPARRCTYHAHWALPGYRIPGREPHELVVSPTGGVAETAALIGVILLIP